MPRAAIASIDDSLRTISDQLKASKEGATGSDPEQLDRTRAKFDQAVKFVELALDCAFLSKASAPELVSVQQALGELVSISREHPEATGASRCATPWPR